MEIFQGKSGQNCESAWQSGCCLKHLDFDFHSGRERKIGKRFDGAGGAFGDVDQAGVRAHLELLAGVFVDECGTVDGEFLDFSRKGNWAGYD